MRVYIIVSSITLALGILITIYAKWVVELLHDTDRDIAEGLEKTTKIPHLKDFLAPEVTKSGLFVLCARVFGIFVTIIGASLLYAAISMPTP